MYLRLSIGLMKLIDTYLRVFSLKIWYLLNLSLIYICKLEIYKTSVKSWFLII